jgi:hypothetical protein
MRQDLRSYSKLRFGSYGTQYTMYKTAPLITMRRSLVKVTSDVQAVMSFADKRYRSSCSGAGTEVISRKLFVLPIPNFPLRAVPGTPQERGMNIGLHMHTVFLAIFSPEGPLQLVRLVTWWSGSFTNVGSQQLSGIFVAFCVGRVALSTPHFPMFSLPHHQSLPRSWTAGCKIATAPTPERGRMKREQKDASFGLSAVIVLFICRPPSYPAVGVLIKPSPRGV